MPEEIIGVHKGGDTSMNCAEKYYTWEEYDKVIDITKSSAKQMKTMIISRNLPDC